MTQVKLPKEISGEKLEQICIKAAKEMGYKTESIDKFRKSYSLGSVQEHSDYDGTNIIVRSFFAKAFQIRGIKKGENQGCFYIWTGSPFGYASKKKIHQFLNNVSQYLQGKLYK